MAMAMAITTGFGTVGVAAAERVDLLARGRPGPVHRQRHARDLHVGAAGLAVPVLVAGDEEGLLVRQEDAGLVGEGVLGLFQDELEGRAGAEEGRDGRVVSDKGHREGKVGVRSTE